MWKWGLWEVMRVRGGHEGGAVMMTSALVKRDRRSLRHTLPWAQKEEAIWQPSSRTDSRLLNSGFPVSGTAPSPHPLVGKWAVP